MLNEFTVMIAVIRINFNKGVCQLFGTWRFVKFKDPRYRKKTKKPTPLPEFNKVPAQTHDGNRFEDDPLRIRGFDLSLNTVRC
jgi:hypothetical protein